MLRLFIYLAVIVALATGLSWLADRPGSLVINWEGRVVETSVFYAVVLLSLLIGAVLIVWSVLRHIWESPAAVGSFLSRRREKRGLDSLSAGMIAIGAGDRSEATKYAIQARKTLPNEPLTHLLRAQAAQLAGDKATARRIYEAMLNTPDTEQLGLRGLFLEAEQEGELEAARQFAERAVRLNPKLKWPVDALFDLQCKSGDWAGALETVAVARKNGHIEKASAERRKAVLMTAQAQVAEDKDPERALQLALDAHKLAPGLVPAAAIAGRLLSSRGNTPKATKIIQSTWQKSPHPDLAVAYAYSRLGDSPRDRVERVKKLAALNPYSLESPIAVAVAAIEAKDFASAREALEPLLENRLTQRVCTLMARIEGEELGDKGRVREWLARAVNAPRDPAWTADGVVSNDWAPVSPVTGALDAFQWRVPIESAEKTGAEIIASKLEELVALGASPTVAMAAESVAADTEAAAAATASAKAAPVKADIEDADVVEARPATPAPVAKTAAAPAAKAEPAAAAAPRETVTVAAPEPAPEAKQKAPDKVAEKMAEAASRPTPAVPPAAAAADKPASGKPDAVVASTSDAGKPAGDKPDSGATAQKGAAPAVESARASGGEPTGGEPAAKPAASKDSGRPGGGEPPKSGSGGTGSVGPSSGAKAPVEAGKRPAASPEQAARTAAVSVEDAVVKPMTSAKRDARVFVSPRAPDDPGPDGLEPDLQMPTRPTYPVSS